MRVLKILVASVCLVIGSASFAEDSPRSDDLENCLYKTGIRMDPRVCAALRRSEQRDMEIKKRQAEQLEESRRVYEESRAASKAKELEENKERERIYAERSARDQAERETQKKRDDAERAKEDRQERAQEKKQADIVNAKKQVCGDDYGAPKIGMTLGRAQQCVSKFRLTSQVNRADGVVSMYNGGGFYLHVMDGRIVAWTR